MNILFPINGLGKRFSENGYTKPKPLINVMGEPMIVRVLESFDFNSNDKIHIIYHRFLRNHNFEHVIQRAFPNLKKQIKFCCLEHDTKGAAHTLVEAIEFFGLDTEDLLVADCDVVYKEPVLAKFRKKTNSSLGVSKDFSKNAIYSYIEINNGEVKQIKEKQKISDDICCGLYFFKASDISKAVMIYNYGITSASEYYVSFLYENLINLGSKVEAVNIFLFDCIGTPIQLQSFCGEKITNKKRFCFDLDNTLVDSSGVNGDYTKSKPIHKNINFLKKLKEHGAYIIIYTARRMRTHKGDVKKVIDEVGNLTKEMLKKYEVPYDELIFGKPWAHFYIDDLAILADEELDKSVGYYFNKLESRSKHELTYFDDKCVKKGDLSGECYWYENAPTEIIKKYFPKFHKVSNNEIIMDNIRDIPLSQLYVRNCFSKENLRAIFDALKDFHAYGAVSSVIDFSENYCAKINKREADILNFCPNAKQKIDDIKNALQNNIKIEKDSIRLVHGDPVFSNIFCSHTNQLKFIDVRGKVGMTPTIYGHMLYDYAKVYQSIIGYDFILLDLDVDKNIVKKNKEIFKKMFTEIFCVEKFNQTKIITQSLILSLVPLHPKKRAEKFLNLIDEA